MKLSDSQRVLIGSFLVILFSLLNNLHVLSSVPFKPENINKDKVIQAEATFAALKKDFSVSEPLGYIADKNTTLTLADSTALEKFYITQYAIIPTVLTNSTKPHFVLGNFNKSIDTTFIAEKRLMIRKKIDNNTILLSHTP
jgi:hypothetical protein